MAEKKYDSAKDMVVGDKLMLFVEVTKELKPEKPLVRRQSLLHLEPHVVLT